MNVQCPECLGSGYDPMSQSEDFCGPCDTCKGEGSLPIDWLPGDACLRCFSTIVAQLDGDNVCEPCGLYV